MIEVYSNNLAVNAGSTISFSNSTKTNSNISLSGNEEEFKFITGKDY